jgi:dolichol-phosphate mannosyltransferase
MVIVSIPAYEEELALPPLIEAMIRLREASLPDMRLIVVDDGSGDSTAQVVRELSKKQGWISLVRHEQNMGLSQAIQSGFRAALKEAKPGDVIVTLDADNTQSPDTILPMLARMAEGYDVIVASRFRPGAKVYGVPAMRRFYSRVMSVLFQWMLAVKGIRDYSCGFRAYRAEVLARAYDSYGQEFITERGFACMVEILLQLNRLGGVKFAEVPFILRYDLKPTETKMRVGKTITDTLWLAVRHRFTRKPQAQ